VLAFDPDSSLPVPYPRIELAEGYFLEGYLGWTLVDRGERWKVLERRSGPLSRLLYLSDSSAGTVEHAKAADVLRRVGLRRPWVRLTWNDFSGRDDWPFGRSLSRTLEVATEARWFGVGTYVFDLARTDEELFARVLPRERTKIRKSSRGGITTDFLEAPTTRDLAEFVAFYTRMARERGLDALHLPTLSRMFADGVAVMGRARDESDHGLAWSIVYFTREHGYYLYGVHDPDARDAGGHLLHMRTLSYVRSRGRRYYDFGLVGSADEREGIHRYKRSFGGSFLPSGKEWSLSPVGLSRAVSLAKRVRATIARMR
jgi:hypothetical protein